MEQLKDNTQQAIEFFDNEIKQFEMMLQGSLNKNYECHIQRKIDYYKMAVNILRSIDEK